MKLSLISLSTAVAVATIMGGVTASSAPVFTVTQGDQILTGAPGFYPSGSCTLGFNAEGFSYTAAHCGNSGDYVYILDAQGRVQGPLGVLTNSPHYNGSNKTVAVVNDWATISWGDSVRLGPNRYSGDTIVPISDVQLGETVCVYGNTTKRESCGNFAGRTGTTFYVDHATADHGDSGGPLWIPGKGLIGVLSGSDEIEYLSTLLFTKYHLQLDLIRATAPGVNGGAVSDDDVFHVAQRWDQLGRPDHIVTVSENSNLSNGDSTAEGSSDLTEDEIWGLVSGVIALISVLVGLARQFGFVR